MIATTDAGLSYFYREKLSFNEKAAFVQKVKLNQRKQIVIFTIHDFNL